MQILPSYTHFFFFLNTLMLNYNAGRQSGWGSKSIGIWHSCWHLCCWICLWNSRSSLPLNFLHLPGVFTYLFVSLLYATFINLWRCIHIMLEKTGSILWVGMGVEGCDKPHKLEGLCEICSSIFLLFHFFCWFILGLCSSGSACSCVHEIIPCRNKLRSFPCRWILTTSASDTYLWCWFCKFS